MTIYHHGEVNVNKQGDKFMKFKQRSKLSEFHSGLIHRNVAEYPQAFSGDLGVETLEWIALAAVLAILIAAVMAILPAGGFFDAIFYGLMNWVQHIGGDIAIGGPTMIQVQPPSEPIIRLIGLIVIVFISLVVVSKVAGRPWERDLVSDPRKTEDAEHRVGDIKNDPTKSISESNNIVQLKEPNGSLSPHQENKDSSPQI